MPDETEAAPSGAEAAARETSAVEAAVWRWFNARIANSPVSRSTEAVSHLIAEIPALIGALESKGA